MLVALEIVRCIFLIAEVGSSELVMTSEGDLLISLGSGTGMNDSLDEN